MPLYSVSGGGSVSDTVYGAGWNGDTTAAPSKNAVYDKIEALGSGTDPSTSFKGVACLTAVAQGDPLTATGLTETPVGYAGGMVNNQVLLCGDAVKTTDFYWSADAGVTARAYGAVASGDKPYLGTTWAAAGGTDTADFFSALYNV